MFEFRLQRILDLRVRREQEAASRHVEAEARAEEARRAQASLERIRVEGRQRLAEAHGSRRTVGELRSLGLVLEGLDHRIAQAEEATGAAEAGARESRVELATALRDRHVLDRLRGRHLEAWRSGEAQLDRTVMDGIALTRFVRGAPTGLTGEEEG